MESAVEARNKEALRSLGQFYPDSAPFIFKQYEKSAKDKYKQHECIKILAKMGTDKSLGFVAKIIKDKNTKMKIREIAAKYLVDEQRWRGGDVLLKTFDRMDIVPKELRETAFWHLERLRFWPVTRYAKCLPFSKQANFPYDKQLEDLISIGGPYLMLHLHNVRKQGKLDRKYILSLYMNTYLKPAIELSSLFCTLLENEPNTVLRRDILEDLAELHPAVAVKYIGYLEK